MKKVPKLILEFGFKKNHLRYGLKVRQFAFPSVLFLMLFISLESFAGFKSLKIDKVYLLNDSTEVLMKCLELSELQQYYPKESNGTSYALKIMQHGVSFSPSTNITHDGKAVLFLSKAQINDNSETAYFYFNEFVIEGDKARVDFAFNYDVVSAPKMQMVSLELQKTSSGWVISHTKIESR